MSAVFDASALIAFLRNESGVEIVENQLLREPAASFAHAINLCEVYYDFCRAAGQDTAESAIQDLLASTRVRYCQSSSRRVLQTVCRSGPASSLPISGKNLLNLLVVCS
jgi:PIN domain nuclease of toxin-antitoxin system